MITTLAACCLVSTKPGVANGTNLPGHFAEPVKCAYCDAEYRIDYEPSEYGRIQDYEGRLRAEAQRRVNADHPSDPESLIGHAPIISIMGLE